MIEYDYEEAIQVLNELRDSMQSSIESVGGDLDFIKEQLTITQVSKWTRYFLYV